MRWRQLFVRKSMATLRAEAEGEQRLRRALGPVSLTALGVGAIIGAGIFAMTGRAAAEDAGPAMVISFIVTGIGCAFAALCYAEFAAMAPVAGSAYTYAYATLGELFAWIIGWDLVLEYAMSCSVVAAHWTSYFNELLRVVFHTELPAQITSDPFTDVMVNGQPVQAWFNLPAVLILLVCTVILVIGIKQSASTNAVLVVMKLAVVLFVIGLGIGYVNKANWTSVPVEQRKVADSADFLRRHPEVAQLLPANETGRGKSGAEMLQEHPQIAERLSSDELREFERLKSQRAKWGLCTVFGLKDLLTPVDETIRSPFMPYGISGIILGAALVFFAYIGFDSISTHSEEAKRPQRDVPIGILLSLSTCTVLYILVAGVITGMEPYPTIDTEAAVAAAFRRRAAIDQSPALRWAAALIAIGALAGMTSVLLVTFLSQARVFLAMARDGLLPPGIFGAIHPRFRTPHLSTILTGVVVCLVSALTPIRQLENMVNIGTQLAFVMVCAAVLLLRLRQPKALRPFRCPAVYLVAPLGIFFNVGMALFLPIETWWRLAIWLCLGLVVYFLYSIRHSVQAAYLPTSKASRAT